MPLAQRISNSSFRSRFTLTLATSLLLSCYAIAQTPSGNPAPELTISAKTPHNAVMAGHLLNDGRIALEAGGEGESILIGQTITATPSFLKLPESFLNGFAGRSGLFVARSGGDGRLDVRAYGKHDEWLYSSDAWPYTSVAIHPNGAMVAEIDSRDTPGRTVTVRLSSLYFPASMPNTMANEKPLALWKITTDADPKIVSNALFYYAFTAEGLFIAVDQYNGTIHRYDTAKQTELPTISLSNPSPAANSWFQATFHLVGSTRLSADGTAIAISQAEIGVRLVRLRDGAILATTKPEIVPETIASLATGAFLFGTKDGRLLLWSEKSEAAELAHFPAAISYIVPLEARHLVIVATADGVNHILDLASGTERLTLLLQGKDQWALVAPDGRFDASDFGAKDLSWKIGGTTLPFEAYADDLATPGLSRELLDSKFQTDAVRLQQKERRLPTLTLSAQLTQQDTTTQKGESASVTLTLHAPSGVSIRNPRLKRNGVLIKEWERSVKDGETLTYEAELVAGTDNIFTAYAYNQSNVKSEDASFTLPATGKPIRPGELWIIAVGINAYKNPNFDLHYAVNDARLATWSLAVQRQTIAESGKQAVAHPMQGYEGKPILNDAKHFIDMRPSMGPAHLRLLLDQDATRQGILDAIHSYSAQARPEDTFLLFFAGHGVAAGERYYLLPHDFNFSGTPSQLSRAPASVLQQSALSDEDLRQALTGEQASTAALILDACQSGAVTGDSLLERRGPMNSNGLRQLAYDKNMFLLAASLSTQSAAEQASVEDGVLTYTLFQRGLLDDDAATTTSPAGPGPVLLGEWLSWATRNIQIDPEEVLQRLRGFPRTTSQTSTPRTSPAGISFQQPRLFAPPHEEPIIVALGATILDPQTVATSLPPGTEGTPSSPIKPVPIPFSVPTPSAASAPNQSKMTGTIELKTFESLGLRPNSLGALSSGHLRSDGKTMVVIRQRAVAEIGLTDTHILWTRPLPDDPRACDMTAQGEMACIGTNGRIFLWTALADSPIQQIAQLDGTGGATLIHWLPNDALLAVRGQSACVLDRSGKCLQKLNQPLAQFPFPEAVAFDQAASRLYLYGWQFNKSAKVLAIFSVPTFTPVASEVITSSLSSKGTSSIAVSPGGDWLAFLDDDGRITARNLRSNTPIKLTGELVNSPAEGPATAIAFSPTNDLLVALIGGTVIHLNPSTGATTGKDQSSVPRISEIVQNSATMVRAGIGIEGGLTVWHGPNADPASTIPGGPYGIYLSYNSGGQLETLLETPDQLRLFTLPNPTVIHQAQLTQSGILKWRSGNFLSLGSGARLYRWNPETLVPLKPIDLGTEDPLAEGATISPDGQWAAWIEAFRPSGNIDIATPAQHAHMKNLATGAEFTLDNATGAPKQILFTPDSRSLAILTTPETTSMLDRAGGVNFVPVGSTHGVTHKIPGIPSGLVCFDATAKTMLAISYTNGEMSLYDLFHGENGKLLRHQSLTEMPSVAELDAKARHAVIGMMDGSITWWDTEAEPILIPALNAPILSIAFRPDGNGFVAGSNDGSIAWFQTTVSNPPQLQAITRWNEAAKGWVTTTKDGRQSVDQTSDATSANASGLLPQLVHESAIPR